MYRNYPQWSSLQTIVANVLAGTEIGMNVLLYVVVLWGQHTLWSWCHFWPLSENILYKFVIHQPAYQMHCLCIATKTTILLICNLLMAHRNSRSYHSTTVSGQTDHYHVCKIFGLKFSMLLIVCARWNRENCTCQRKMFDADGADNDDVNDAVNNAVNDDNAVNEHCIAHLW